MNPSSTRAGSTAQALLSLVLLSFLSLALALATPPTTPTADTTLAYRPAFATNSAYATNSGHATNADSATYAASAGSATNAGTATNVIISGTNYSSTPPLFPNGTGAGLSGLGSIVPPTSALSISGTGVTTLTPSGRLTTIYVNFLAGSGAYTADVVLSAPAGVQANDRIDIVASYPASTNPTIRYRSLTSTGTIIMTPTAAVTAGTHTASFVYDGSNWDLENDGAILSKNVNAAEKTALANAPNVANGHVVLDVSGTTAGALTNAIPYTSLQGPYAPPTIFSPTSISGCKAWYAADQTSVVTTGTTSTSTSVTITGSTSGIYNGMSVSGAGVPTSPAPTATISGSTVTLSSATTSSVTGATLCFYWADGATSVGINDLSGNAANLTSSGTVTYAASGINRRPSFRFNGSSSLSASTFFDSSYSGGSTFFLVFQERQAMASGPTTSVGESVLMGTSTGSYFIGMEWGSFLANAGKNPHTGLGKTNAANIVGFSNGTSRSLLTVNGLYQIDGTSNFGTASASTGLTIGKYGGGGFNFTGDIAEIIIYNRVLTNAEMNQVNAYLMPKYYPNSSLPLIIFDGDSIAAGITGIFANGLQQYLSEPWKIQSWAVGRQTAATIVSSLLPHHLTEYDPRLRDIVVVYWAGHNDILTNGSASGAYASAVADVTALRARGYKVIVIGLPSSQASGSWSDAAKSTYNALWRSNWQGLCDGYLDIERDVPLLGANGVSSNATYFSDGTHPTTAGYALLTPVLGALIDSITTNKAQLAIPNDTSLPTVVLKGNGSGGTTKAIAGTDYSLANVQTGTLTGGTATKTVPAGCHPFAFDTSTGASLLVSVSGTTATITGTGTDPFTLFNFGSQ